MSVFSALIVAAGSGSRMGAAIPKQFLKLEGRPLLMHTLEKFASTPEQPELILVLSPDQFDHWKQLCMEFRFNLPHHIIAGGATRAGSVVNGLKVMDPTGIVAIHDGVRPLLSTELISRCFREAAKFGSAIPTVVVKDTLREVNGPVSVNRDRDKYRLVQTPQCFRTSAILDCYLNAPLNIYSDDAGIAEACGIPLHLVEGEETNIKITTPADLIMAGALISAN